MRNPDQWKPSRLARDPRTGGFKANRAAIYGGSYYIADVQTAVYVPLIQEHISGHVLDCGCGPVPYHELYKPKVTNATCIDWSQNPDVIKLIDQQVDINGPLPFAEGTFDSVLCTDVIAHIKRPWELFKELSRVLKPGGRMLVTTPFIYWLAEHPHEYYHPTRFGLQDMTKAAGMEVIYLEPYGGQADVLMDTLNKMMDSGFSNRLFLLMMKLPGMASWLKRNRKRTKEIYALVYCIVARKV
jgi:SAM-dependent methyltransferase